MPILDRLQGPADLRGLIEPQLEPARRRDPRDDHPDRRRDRRPPRRQPGRRRDHDRAPPAARLAARPDRLGHGPPGLRPQAADRPAGAVRHASPDRRRRRLPAPHRVAHDVFDGGHAGTGLSIAEGLATARDIRHAHASGSRSSSATRRCMTGLSLEALNDIGHRQTPAADRAQRQRDVDQPDGRGALDVPLRDQALAAPGSRASRA